MYNFVLLKVARDFYQVMGLVLASFIAFANDAYTRTVGAIFTLANFDPAGIIPISDGQKMEIVIAAGARVGARGRCPRHGPRESL